MKLEDMPEMSINWSIFKQFGNNSLLAGWHFVHNLYFHVKLAEIKVQFGILSPIFYKPDFG